jgi:CubicO group peptidase (beta-lactamase class C family)
MLELDQLLTDAVERQDLPFAVAMVANRERVLWQGSAGHAPASTPAGPQTLFRIFSMTKAIGALAAMILIERDLISIDAPIASVLPVFDEIQVLETIGPDGPVLRSPRQPVTLRHLLTSTAGFAYEAWNKKQAIWQMVTGAAHPVTGTLDSLKSPLMFDPGEDFAYSHSYDWIGPIVERLDGRKVERFCQDEIFDPLGMIDTAFEPDLARDRLAGVKLRGADGAFCDFDLSPTPHPEVYGLGQALYSTAPDYMRFLRTVLNRGELDGHRLIGTDTIEFMMTGQMGAMTMPPLKSIAPLLSADFDPCPGTPKTWTAGFVRNEADMPGMRRAGSLCWAGFLNTHYWVDPVTDLAAVLMTQSLPFGDPGFMETYFAFEQAVYRTLGGASAVRSVQAVESA